MFNKNYILAYFSYRKNIYKKMNFKIIFFTERYENYIYDIIYNFSVIGKYDFNIISKNKLLCNMYLH